MSQYESRLLCGTGLSQSGPDGFCAAHRDQPNYNAQFLLENPNPGDSSFASAGRCLKNAHLAFTLFDSAGEPDGRAGYERYLSWIKSEVIAGDQVTIGVLNQFGDDPQYDHEVTVSRIGTDHAVDDPTYYGDDVLFFDDHTSGGTPYDQGYTFDSLAKTRADANSPLAHSYSILIPGGEITSGTGGDGIHENPTPIRAVNYGFSVSGPADPEGETLPITLTIVGSTTDGSPNSARPGVDFNFEDPGLNASCTNQPPNSWMGLTFRAEVSGLTPGTEYNLYRYEFDGVSGVGSVAALKVPDSDFNAHAGEATAITPFVAAGPTYSQILRTTSDKITVLRCVKAGAP
jgi:hypothetical protein